MTMNIHGIIIIIIHRIHLSLNRQHHVRQYPINTFYILLLLQRQPLLRQRQTIRQMNIDKTKQKTTTFISVSLFLFDRDQAEKTSNKSPVLYLYPIHRSTRHSNCSIHSHTCLLLLILFRVILQF